jgi:hypothetical protein
MYWLTKEIAFREAGGDNYAPRVRISLMFFCGERSPLD